MLRPRYSISKIIEKILMDMGVGVGRTGWDKEREYHGNIYTNVCVCVCVCV